MVLTKNHSPKKEQNENINEAIEIVKLATKEQLQKIIQILDS